MLGAVQQKFVLHWGEMGTRWGVNRTVAQIHALLYISPKPLNAEEISDTLSVARSNVSTSLRELQGWGIVRIVHVMGDRRDHFESLKEVWDLFRVILKERKRREVDPTLAVLRECVREAGGAQGDPHAKEKLAELLDFFETGVSCYAQFGDIPAGRLRKLAKMGNKVQKLLGFLPG